MDRRRIFFDPSDAIIERVDDLVFPCHHQYLSWAEQQGRDPVPDTVESDEFPCRGDRIDACQVDVSGKPFDLDVAIFPFVCRDLPIK